MMRLRSSKHLTALEVLARAHNVQFSHMAIITHETERKIERGGWKFEDIWNDNQYNLARLMLSEPILATPLKSILARLDGAKDPEVIKLFTALVNTIVRISKDESVDKDQLIKVVLDIDSTLIHTPPFMVAKTLFSKQQQINGLLLQDFLVAEEPQLPRSDEQRVRLSASRDTIFSSSHSVTQQTQELPHDVEPDSDEEDNHAKTSSL